MASQLIIDGKILAIDIKQMEKIKKVEFLKCDFLEEQSEDKILNFFSGKIDVIISDMAADTTGNKNLDCIRTNLLCVEVLHFSIKMLKQKGTVISKVFMGEDFLAVKDLAKKNFKKVDFFKPESSKNESKETYMHCSLLKSL